MVNFVLILELYEKTSSSFLVSVLVVLTVLPTILFSSLAGIYADTFNRKYLLVFSNLVRSILVVTLSFFPAEPWLFLVFGFLLSSMSQFFGPAQSATIPHLVQPRQLFSANTLFMFTTYSTVLFGYTMAGPALHYLGDLRTASLLVVAFTASAMLNLQLPFFRDHLERQWGRSYLDRAFKNLAVDFREGMNIVRKSRIILTLLLLVSILFAVERALVGLLPSLAGTVFQFSVEEISYFLIAPAGIGAILAVALGRHVSKRVRTFSLVVFGLLLVGCALLLIPLSGLVESLAVGHADVTVFAALLSFASGVASILVIVAGQTLLHERTPSDTHGRIFGGLISLMNAIGLPLILLVGLLAGALSLQAIVFCLGVLLVIAGLFAVFSLRADVEAVRPLPRAENL